MQILYLRNLWRRIMHFKESAPKQKTIHFYFFVCMWMREWKKWGKKKETEGKQIKTHFLENVQIKDDVMMKLLMIGAWTGRLVRLPTWRHWRTWNLCRGLWRDDKSIITLLATRRSFLESTRQGFFFFLSLTGRWALAWFTSLSSSTLQNCCVILFTYDPILKNMNIDQKKEKEKKKQPSFSRYVSS